MRGQQPDVPRLPSNSPALGTDRSGHDLPEPQLFELQKPVKPPTHSPRVGEQWASSSPQPIPYLDSGRLGTAWVSAKS